MWRNCTKSRRILRMWISVTQKNFNSPTSCNFIALKCFKLEHSPTTSWTLQNLEHLFSGDIFQLQMSTAPRALMCACTHQRLLWNLDHRNTQKKQNKANNTTITTGLRPRCAKFLFNLLIVLFSPACALATVASYIPSPSITVQSHYSLPIPAKDQPLRVKCKSIRYRIQVLL
jgi:hypothetical protein